MNSHIYISPYTITHFFSPDSSCEKEINHSRIVMTEYSMYSVNEANIAHQIHQIPYYTNFYTTLEDYDEVDISETTDRRIKPIQHPDITQYYLFRYTDKNAVPFLDVIYQSTHITPLLSNIIDSFSHIVYALHILSQNQICMFYITPRNIVYLEDYKTKPVLSHFRYSLRLNKLNYTYISHILNKIEEFTYFPLEIHILYYFVKHHLNTISYTFIDEFCEEFVESQSVLRFFSDSYREKYKEQCILVMRAYMNQPRHQIIEDLLKRCDKWDVYAISVIYVHLFGCITNVFSLQGTAIQFITDLLSKNLHPDAYQRLTLEQTLQLYHKTLSAQTSWTFMRLLDNHKMSTLMTELSS